MAESMYFACRKNIMNYSDTSGSLGIWLIFALVYEKEVCFLLCATLISCVFSSTKVWGEISSDIKKYHKLIVFSLVC